MRMLALLLLTSLTTQVFSWGQDAQPAQGESAAQEKAKVPAAKKDEVVVTDKLKADERPALRFLEDAKERKEQRPQHENRLENPNIHDPNDFTVEYRLDAASDVSLTVINEQGLPVGNMRVPSGQQGAQAGNNEVVVWDGRDLTGRQAPAGNYMVFEAVTSEAAGSRGTMSSSGAAAPSKPNGIAALRKNKKP